jgi:drug/metabolite transporter (DMT)-like permease
VAAWTLIGVLLTFKAVTITLIFIMARPNDQLVVQLVAMNWLWLIVFGILMSAIPFGLWFRLMRARARRRQLQRSEWDV